MAKKTSTYQILVYIAYAFYILFAATWLVTNVLSGAPFAYMALLMLAIFLVQCYYRNKLVNLIIGILSLGGSIFMLMEVFSTYNLFAKNATFDGFIDAMIGLSVFSIIMSGILIFSYMKLNFQDE